MSQLSLIKEKFTLPLLKHKLKVNYKIKLFKNINDVIHLPLDFANRQTNTPINNVVNLNNGRTHIIRANAVYLDDHIIKSLLSCELIL